MTKKNKVSVEIFGETYPVKGDVEPSRIMEVAALIDERMRRTARANPHLAVSKIAVLTALNIAEEYLRLEQDYRQLVEMMRKDK